ncbi:Glucose/arabinose dehydrogenase, beta-propeller fold [Micromonospora pattaloongensis]|uniref:Glucose/arabinose dehydrogenase, beta-propeller fold n=1 Tax=Micromonospora pattaloongensis TaxID=405436 RepID=A0A1H3LQ14_9ACTN|nr:PQQ-dependent sugar dehydrogenase [Micromonospora pattaloongensis]SDY66416.1 Glucose/arabinose dehydrogenase, beta-propeller fold [Micromonospora pattaloongensis]
MSHRRHVLRSLLAGALLAALLVSPDARPAAAATVPSGFQEQIVFRGLTQPTNIEFAPDGRVFVAEKAGRIKVFDTLADSTPTLFADLSANVHNQWDRGLLGLALAPNFPLDPWVYVLYTYDAPPGRTAPVWNDVCANANNGNCVVTGRLSRLRADGNVMSGTEQTLIHDWCQQFPSHSIGDLRFGPDGALYVSAGDGASFSAVDYGQLGSPHNPCADPPGGSAGPMTPPAAEGGALRSQDVRTGADPTGLDGTVLRLNPETGAAMAGNPLMGSADPNTRRIVGTGLRNPFRFTVRPGTDELWLGDVGWSTWEEVNRLVAPTSGVTNFGWPCYEGAARMASYDNANLSICENLYAAGGVTAPYRAYQHSAKVVPGEACPSGGSSTAGLAFYPTVGGPYPAAYHGALFFSDYSRTCIWAMKPSSPGGLPSPSNVETFVSGAAGPIDLAVGPGGELYYVDIGGTVRRIRYFAGNRPPTAAISADRTAGQVPLTVEFDGTGSVDPDAADQGRLSYAWDFTNDGTVDATTATAQHTYTAQGSYTAKLTVTDTLGASDTATVTIAPGNSAPTAEIATPAESLTWAVGDEVSFSGSATDPQQGRLPASALSWQLRMQHCAVTGECHTHFVREWSGVADGSFTAPDHEYPSHLELVLTATDAQGLTGTTVRRLDPKTVTLTFASQPAGRQLSVGPTTGAAPFTTTVIQGSTNTISAPSPQSAGGNTYTFSGWSDGGAQTHVITAPTAPATYTAHYRNSTGDQPGDFSGDGRPDVLSRQSSSGALYLYTGNGTAVTGPVQLGTGWNSMDAIVRPGDFDRDGHGDVLARETATGAAWLYPGTGSGLRARVRVGTGWNGLREITPIGDLDRDGYPDLLAADPAGALYLYPGRGNGFAARVQVGTSGWNAMDELVGAGDFNRDGFPDMLARERATGALFLYPGRQRALGPRTRIGTGWGGLRDLVGVGDFDGDGYRDVVGIAQSSADLLLYRGRGNGLVGPTRIGTGWGAMRPLL